jgi:hypothetical protein
MRWYRNYLELEPSGGHFASAILIGPELAGFDVSRLQSKPSNSFQDPVEWARVSFGFLADEVQARVLRCEAKRGLLNCTRQWGKSSVTSLKALWTALQSKDALVLVMSPSKRQSGEFLKKVTGFVRQLGLRVRRDGVNEMSLAFPNGSRIVALPGVEGTMRGFSAVDLLIIDEAARVTDEQYFAAGASLAVKDGALWLLSTPKGSRGFFYQEWERGGDGWERVRVEAKDCPRISARFLERERARMGEAWYRQEYCCEFVGTEASGFRPEWIEAAWDEEGGELA